MKGRAEKPTRARKNAALNQNTVTAGAHDVTRLYPAGKRLLKPGRNFPTAHAPRVGKEVFCWDWNSQGGFPRGDKCARKRDRTSDKNLHWAFASEMVRRGGHAVRDSRISPGNIDGAIDQLRGSDKRTHGGHPIAPSKAWRQKPAVAYSVNLSDHAESGQVSPGWGVTKRELNWDAINQLTD